MTEAHAAAPSATPTAFTAALAAHVARTEAMLEHLLPQPDPATSAGERELREAMRYGVLGGGKRLRAFLCLETALMFGAPLEAAARVAAAFECLHAYSLIHDDLPCMDDDDLRRGRPTVHRAFSETTAVLAGDALQTLAFEILADPATHASGTVRARLCLRLA
ncbi:MAG: polyprenyl synthetase family protein, partial [Pseudomonadota bacterium]